MRTILLSLLLASACAVDSKPDSGPELPTDSTVDSPVLDPECAPQPTLVLGVVRCVDLAPECSVLAPPGEQGGLHCITGYEDDPTVPCFCVGISTPDSWCMRSAP